MADVQSQPERNMDLDQIKDLLLSDMRQHSLAPIDNGKGLVFNTQDGKVFIPDQAIEYYYTVFNENIQKIGKYEGYITQVQEWLKSEDINVKSEKLKEVSKWFNMSELFSEIYSVVSQWLSDDTVTKDMMSVMYEAYSTDDSAKLDERTLPVYTKSINKSLRYYDILLRMFTVMDKKIFDR